eukprot:jgi/Ulvmu1/5764/UM025_0018.1
MILVRAATAARHPSTGLRCGQYAASEPSHRQVNDNEVLSATGRWSCCPVHPNRSWVSTCSSGQVAVPGHVHRHLMEDVGLACGKSSLQPASAGCHERDLLRGPCADLVGPSVLTVPPDRILLGAALCAALALAAPPTTTPAPCRLKMTFESDVPK